jgi:hypothetical protein
VSLPGGWKSVSELEPGDVNGQGFADIWYVLSPKARPITSLRSISGTTPTTQRLASF